MTIDDEDGGTFELTLARDGTFATASDDGICTMRGGWTVTPGTPTLTARGLCGSLAMTIESTAATPEVFRGELTTGRGPSTPISAEHRPDPSD